MKLKIDLSMWLKSIKENRSCYFILLIVGIAFLILNILTPEYLDDYLYKYTFINGIADRNHPIKTLEDIYTSQLDHYFSFNGRVVIHSFVQLFSGILGKGLFNFVNAVIFTSFIALSVKYTINRLNKPLILLTTLLVLLCFPAFNDTCLWMTGSIGYLWTGLFTIIFLYIFKNLQKKEITSSSYLLVLGGIPLGWTHEGTAFPLALSLIVYCFYNRKQIIKSTAFPFAFGFIMGSFLCTFSPATLGRASSGSELTIMGIANKILSGFYLLSNLKLIYIAIAGLIWMIYIEGKLKVLNFIKEHILIFGGIFFSMGIVFFSGFHSSRTAFGTELLSLLLIIRIFALCQKKIFTKVASVILCTIYGSIVYFSTLNYQEYQKILEQIKEPTTSIITTTDPKYGIMENWIRTPLISSNSEYYFSFSPSSWENQYIASTYHKDSLVFLPQEFIEIISSNKFDDFDTTLSLPFYAKRLSKYQTINKITYQLKKTDFTSLPFYIRPFAHKLGRYTLNSVNTDKFTVIKTNGDTYLLVGKNKMIDTRIKDIIYE